MVLKEVRYSSFCLEKQIVSKYNRIFVKFDNEWLEIVVSEGRLTVENIEEPLIMSVENIEGDFSYPILQFEESLYQKNIQHQTVLSIFKLTLKDQMEVDVGLKILMENQHYITIYDNLELESMDVLFDESVSEDVDEKAFTKPH